MNLPAQRRVSPQARGRELAREGTQLWQETGSVKRAAAERFVPLARQARLLQALSESARNGKSRGRIGVDFGSVGLCHVAAGFTEAMIEFAKGFAIWDLAPGHHVLHAAGGVVLDLQGIPVSLDYQLDSLDDVANAMNRRQKFVAAGGTKLAHEILRTLDA